MSDKGKQNDQDVPVPDGAGPSLQDGPHYGELSTSRPDVTAETQANPDGSLHRTALVQRDNWQETGDESQGTFGTWKTTKQSKRD